MKKVVALLSLFIFFGMFAQAQTVTIEGTQTKGTAGKNADLKCQPVKITKSMKIIKVEGDCAGFWIQNGSVTTHKFWDMKKPIGTILKPGNYYVYPNLKQGQTKAHIKITLQ
jgi:hypothetical protein